MYSSKKKQTIIPMGLAWQSAHARPEFPVSAQHRAVPHVGVRRKSDSSGGPQLAPAVKKQMPPAGRSQPALPTLTNLVGKDRVAHDFADNTALKGRDAMAKVMAAMRAHHVALNGLPKTAFAASSGSSVMEAPASAAGNVVHFASHRKREISVGGPAVVGEIFSAATRPLRSPLSGTGLMRRQPSYAYPVYKPRWAA